MIREHDLLNGHELEQTPGDSGGQESLACCSPWDHKESDTTQQLKNKYILRACFIGSRGFFFWFNFLFHPNTYCPPFLPEIIIVTIWHVYPFCYIYALFYKNEIICILFSAYWCSYLTVDSENSFKPIWMHLASISGEGNGTPLQYSCLENPVDGGAW